MRPSGVSCAAGAVTGVFFYSLFECKEWKMSLLSDAASEYIEEGQAIPAERFLLTCNEILPFMGEFEFFLNVGFSILKCFYVLISFRCDGSYCFQDSQGRY